MILRSVVPSPKLNCAPSTICACANAPFTILRTLCNASRTRRVRFVLPCGSPCCIEENPTRKADKVGLRTPYVVAISPIPQVSTVALRLGCCADDCSATLDTYHVYRRTCPGRIRLVHERRKVSHTHHAASASLRHSDEFEPGDLHHTGE